MFVRKLNFGFLLNRLFHISKSFFAQVKGQLSKNEIYWHECQKLAYMKHHEIQMRCLFDFVSFKVTKSLTLRSALAKN